MGMGAQAIGKIGWVSERGSIPSILENEKTVKAYNTKIFIDYGLDWKSGLHRLVHGSKWTH